MPTRQHVRSPALQLICLSSGGGPSEDNVTGFLVRSTRTHWARNSLLAVDAGSHLAPIIRILESSFPRESDIAPSPPLKRSGSETSTSSRSPSPDVHSTTLTSGPFAGLACPFDSARANAAHVVRECVSTYLITHPHLDHIAAFAINTAAFHNTTRPKRLAGLPSTVSALKAHIFNDVIWPNLTDEDGGVGLVTFQRLTQGGNVGVGAGRGKGYIEVADGLCVKGMKITHGHCARGAASDARRDSDVGLSQATLAHGLDEPATRTPSISAVASASATPGGVPMERVSREVVVDSTAYFIRDDATGQELLIFGDVEPDSLSLRPRTAQVWGEAAPKIASGVLRAVVIECSYDDGQADAQLFGHLAPRHLVRELGVLAEMVRVRREERRVSRKRKRGSEDWSFTGAEESATNGGAQRKTRESSWLDDSHAVSPMGKAAPERRRSTSYAAEEEPAPLSGVTVIVMHMKDTLADGPAVGSRILRQLQEHERRMIHDDGSGLGCEFVISKAGESYTF